jgi:hypothetical protein
MGCCLLVHMYLQVRLLVDNEVETSLVTSIFISSLVFLSLSNNFFSIRCEVFTAVTMKNVVFWDVKPRGTCKSRRFGGT